MKSQFLQLELSLATARAAIVGQLSPLATERVPLHLARARVCAATVFANHPSPSCDQSTRDGFALANEPLFSDQRSAVFHLVGEIAAGCVKATQLAPGQAVHIMTGAAVPAGTDRVLPFEVCREQEGQVQAPLVELEHDQRHIRCQGCEVRLGQVLVAAGTRLLPDHLRLLAEDDCGEIMAHRQPRAVVICTGSELIHAGEPLSLGRKVSGNGTLLAALLEAQGCACVRCLTAKDDADSLVKLLADVIEHDQPDLLITTGGMGPGKFDLTEQVFAQLGGESVYNRLRLRPGQATLFGLLNELPFFGLPGTPPAVRLLFHELVVPALIRLQGEDLSCSLVKARLDGPAPALQRDCTVLKGAVAWLDTEGQLRARPTEGLEPLNAILHLSGGQEELVSLRLIGPLAAADNADRRTLLVRQ